MKTFFGGSILKKFYIYFADYKPLSEVPQLVTAYLEGKLLLDELISNKFKLMEINDAVDLMKSGKG